jgi:hypothetical protein
MPNFPAVTRRFLYELMDGEPATGADGATVDADGNWERGIPRDVLRFARIGDLRDYVAETIALVYRSVPPLPLAAPSPLGLVSALDYLDVVWRLAEPKAGHLLELHSAQRVAQLAFPAQTQNEFDSRLTGLVEILRSVSVPKSAQGKRNRDKPLNAIADHLVQLLPASESRLRGSIDTLHLVIDVRDSSQHARARSKGAAALEALGVGYPPTSWAFAWQLVTARTIEALDAIREELATLTM